MIVDLDRKDIVSLLRGSTPNYEVMDKIPEKLGHYAGGFKDEWQWHHFLEDCEYSDKYLYELYLMCKNSWK